MNDEDRPAVASLPTALYTSSPLHVKFFSCTQIPWDEAFEGHSIHLLGHHSLNGTDLFPTSSPVPRVGLCSVNCQIHPWEYYKILIEGLKFLSCVVLFPSHLFRTHDLR